jgi:aspartate aminotransferase
METLAIAREGALSHYARRIEESTILQIAGEIREHQKQGKEVLNLTVGDFRPDQFPIPKAMLNALIEALQKGETNYPPANGMPQLREAVLETVRADHGLEYPLESVLIGAGARPIMFATFMALVDRDEPVVFPVPSWNNHHYSIMCNARPVAVTTTPEKNFHLDRADLEPHLKTARMVSLNSPLNPTGTCISRAALAGICEAIVGENERRERAGERPIFLLYDMVYHTLRFGQTEHVTPVGLVPEMVKWTVLVDSVSKNMCGTGLRVGWGLAPPVIAKKMIEMAGHYGTWAPRAEQVATAKFLRDREAKEVHRATMIREVSARLDLLHEGLSAMRKDGLPVEPIAPQGAIYLSARFNLIGRTVRGRTIKTNEDVRRLLLHEAGFAVVPFQAFGLPGETGWARLSVGAVSVDEVKNGLARVRALLEDAHG